MITRRKLLAAVAAGTLTEFALVAAPRGEAGAERINACQQGVDHCSSGGNAHSNGDSCGNSGGHGQDQCHKNDQPRPPACPKVNDQPPVPCPRKDVE